MNMCIPVESDAGLQSIVSPHFGSAPTFLIVDTDTGDFETVENSNSTHAHGACQPLSVLGGHNVDCVVVGGIGVGALNKFRPADIQVYLSPHRTVQETIDAFNARTLQPVTPKTACGHHGQGPRAQGSRGQPVQRRGRQRQPGGRNN